MADTKNTKLEYLRGTCFGCRKCLYCAVDLRTNICGCKLTEVPTKKNRTDSVKQAYTRSYEPTWAVPKFEYIHGKFSEYNYDIDLKISFKFSLCGRCHNILTKLSTAKDKKNIIDTKTKPNTPLSVVEVTIEDETSSKDEEPAFKIGYKLFVKLSDGTSLPAKWFEESISAIDEFLLSIHDKIILLTHDTTNDYCVTFKTHREVGSGTQLIDEQDFVKFKAEYVKLTVKKNDIGIYVTITPSQNKRKKKKLNLSEDEEDTERSNNYKKTKKINRIPNAESLSLHEKIIAENVSKIRNTYHCNIHNKPCLNKEKHKDLHVELTFLMLSIWASDINKGLATIEDLPTHSLFSHNNILSKRKQSSRLPYSHSQELLERSPQTQEPLFLSSPPLSQVQLAQQLSPPLLPSHGNWVYGSQMLQSYQPLLSAPYNPYQTLSHIPLHPQVIRSNSNISLTIPTMVEFLKEIDENEGTGHHYQDFLNKFEEQKVLVKHLRRLTDKDFELCDIKTIGERETLREYAEKYQPINQSF
ncbi:25531_t:CDS:2 [Dentiscutata erythropus]|uniref:25531_t:CDS:1 n=1 Tax=Dentiscutata erythropus TaxID=1348616 RepID=A0A9N9N4F8_9GLOM|nr:25531_t:CDS:2 [Dentiscutata erythropus]